MSAGTPAHSDTRATGILLAAGAGSRFGGRKLLHALPDGTPLGVAALTNLRAAIPRVLVVVRAGDAEVQQLFAARGVTVIECADAADGMGHSLAAGVSASADAAGWIIALADMPDVRPATTTAVARALDAGARIAVPVYRDQRGHPVGFAADLKAELLTLHGDVGARPILERHAAQVQRVSVDDPGILQDVDTQEDLARIAKTQPRETR